MEEVHCGGRILLQSDWSATIVAEIRTYMYTVYNVFNTCTRIQCTSVHVHCGGIPVPVDYLRFRYPTYVRAIARARCYAVNQEEEESH